MVTPWGNGFCFPGHVPGINSSIQDAKCKKFEKLSLLVDVRTEEKDREEA